MGDQLNEYSGGLSFNHTDVTLPGSNALPVAVGRRLATGTRQAALNAGLFGDWDLDLPSLRTVAMQSRPDWFGGNGLGAYNLNRCSQFLRPPSSSYTSGSKRITLGPESWWDGHQLIVPGGGSQTLLGRAGQPTNPIQPSDGQAYPVLTKQNWQFSCLPTLARGSGEGFVARAPDGTRYQFDHMVQRSYPAYNNHTQSGSNIPRVEILILPTLITDRFGNWVRYSYGGADGWRVLSITSSDGRAISFTYSGWGNRIQSISDGTRTWAYGYDGSGALQTVTLPDNSQWRFALADLERDPTFAPDLGCGSAAYYFWDPSRRVGSITHPSGALGVFALQMTAHGRSNVPGTQEGCEGTDQVNGVVYVNRISRYFNNYALVSKTLSGPGMPAMTWQYDYSAACGSFSDFNNCAGVKTVSITDPLNNIVRKSFGTQFGINEGLLLASTVGRGNAVLQTTAYGYRAANAGPYPSVIGFNGSDSDAMGVIHTPQDLRVIVQQGVTMRQATTGFDEHARPTGVTRSSSLGYSKTESTSYHDNRQLWVMGQVASRTVAGLVASSVSYDPATALPSESRQFGKLQARYVFNADGTLASVADELGQTTSFSNYRRGLPQTIAYADGTRISGVVSNIGALTSVTNEAGTTWNYGYDAMGRLASKTPPAGNPTLLAFVQVPYDEYGLGANHWRQTISTGNAVTVNYFDARWRKRLTHTYDMADPGATQRMQSFDHDAYNRSTYSSYPTRSITSITQSLPGKSTAYDALGRAELEVADSELGPLRTVTQYLDGLRKQVTNPRGYSTTTAFQIFDEPNESAITGIGAPEGVNVAIDRDDFGKPRSITRGGAFAGSGPASVSRRYVYDAHQRLCKTIEPEVGATIEDYDLAGNTAWRATGLSLTGTGGCDTASVAAASKVAFTYDRRNRLTGTGFGDGSPAIGRSYTPDGLPLSVVSDESTWTYRYDDRRLLLSETLAFRYGGTWTVHHGYDANGSTSHITYPDGSVLAYNPNALGEATTVGNHARAVSYHPNGAVAGYTLGNGIVHSLTQNTRGLPLLNRDAGVMQDLYGFDGNGNVASITDQQEGVTNRSMGYDGLDRLTSVSAPNVWGNAAYGYDALDNLRTSAVGGRRITHGYDDANRLSSLNINGAITGYAYDSRGNITAKGSQGYYFDQGNRLALANGIARYYYDGLGRRANISQADGTIVWQMYSQAGQLLFGFRQGPAGQQWTQYVYLGGKQIAETTSAGVTSYVHTDALGSPVAKTNAGGAVISRTRYEPYGNTAAGTNPRGIGFTGHVNDVDTGLVYMQQRYYDPNAGRFLSIDPITTDANTGAAFSRYDYVSNNPYRYIDPDGRAKSSGGGFGFGWEEVSNFADSAVTGGYGLQFKQAANAGNYGEAGLKLVAGVAYGVLNVATLGEGAVVVSAASKGLTAAARGLGEASSLANAAMLRGQLVGKEISGGHAFEKHVLDRGEFKGLGIRTREQFAHHIENVVNNPTVSRQLSGGRSAYWQESTRTVVIRNPRAADGGTAFQPATGRAYFDGLR